MNKTVIRCISLIMLVSFPTMGIAQEIAAPPVMVMPRVMNLSNDVKAANVAVVAQENQKHAIESSIRELISQNADLAQTIQEQANTIQTLRSQSIGNDRDVQEIFLDATKYSELKDVLAGYQAQVSERDRLLAERDTERDELRAHVTKINGIFDQSVDASFDVGRMKTLASGLVEQKNMLETKAALLTEQNKQLLDLKEQLAAAKVQMQETVSRYEALRPVPAQAFIVQGPAIQVSTAQPAPVQPPPVQPAPIKTPDIQTAPIYVSTTKPAAPIQAPIVQPAPVNIPSVSIAPIQVTTTQPAPVKTPDVQTAPIYVTTVEPVPVQVPIQTAPIQIFSPSSDPELAAQLKEKIASIAELTAALKTKDEDLRKIDDVILAKDAQIADLKMELAKAKDAIADMAGMSKEIAAFRDKFRTYDGFLDARDRTIANLKARLASAHGVVTNEAMVKMKGEIAAVSYELETSRQDIAADQDQIADLNAIIADLKARLAVPVPTARPREVVRTVEVTVDHREELDEAKAMVADLNTKTVALTSDARDLRTRIDEKVSRLKTLQERASLHEQLSAKRKEHIALLEEKADLTAQKVQKAEAKAQYLEDQLKKTIVFWNTTSADSEQKAEQTRLEFEQKETKIAELTKEIEKQKDLTESQKADASKMLEEFRSRLKETQDVGEDQQRTIAAYEARMKGIEKDSGARELNASMMQEIINRKSADMTNAASQIEKYKGEMAALQERLTVAEAKIKTSVAAEDMGRAQAMLKASREEIASLNQALKDKDANVTRMNADLSLNSKQFAAQLAELEHLKTRIDKGQEQVKALTGELELKDKQIARLKMQLDESKKTIAGMGKDNGAVYREEIIALNSKLKIAELRLKQADVNRDPHQLKEAFADAQQQIKAMREEIKQKEQMLAAKPSAAVNNKDMEALKTQLAAAREELAQMRSAAAKKVPSVPVKDMSAELSAKDKQIKDMENNLSARAKTVASQQTVITDLKAELKNTKIQIDRLNAQVEQIKIRMYDLGNQGYLMRQGKDTSVLIYDTQEQLKTFELKLKEASSSNEAWMAKYNVLSVDLQNTKDLLQQTRNSLQECRGDLQDCRDNASGIGWIKRQLQSDPTSGLISAGK